MLLRLTLRMMSTSAVITTRGLSKDFGSGRGLFELDLEVEQGEVFGFLGPNGAGKSTTMRLLLDLIRPTSGSARVLGLDRQADSLQIRRRVGFLPGDLAMYPKLTGRVVLDYLARAPRRRRPRACATRWPSGSTPISIARSASCRPATDRSSA